MLKEARKPSSDPNQERLRQNKASFNKDVSVFINDVIHLKKLMNGWPSKFFKERSRIIEPIPADPAVIIGSLANDFQELAQRGNAIVQEQLTYAKTRRPKQPKTPIAPSAATPSPPTGTPATPAADLSKQLAAWEQKYELVSEASNPLSRFLTRFKTRTRGTGERARINRIRMDMLKSCIKAYRALGKLQIHVVKSSKNSIIESHKLMQHSWNEWAIVARSFAAFKSNILGASPTKSEDLPEEKEGQEPSLDISYKPESVQTELATPTHDDAESITLSKNMIQDYRKVLSKGRFSYEAIFGDLNMALEKMITASPDQKINLSNLVIEEYRKILSFLNSKYGTNGLTLSQIADIRDAKIQANLPPGVSMPKTASIQLETTAQAFLKKWLGKTKHQLLPQNTSSYRLQIYKLASEVRTDINQVMDLLEKGLDLERLGEAITQVNRKMTSLRMLMRSLHLSEKPDAATTFPL